MSHCRACDCFLNSRESLRKSTVTGEYIELCDYCFKYVKEDFLEVEESTDSLSDEYVKEREVEDLEVFDSLFKDHDEL